MFNFLSLPLPPPKCPITFPFLKGIEARKGGGWITLLVHLAEPVSYREPLHAPTKSWSTKLAALTLKWSTSASVTEYGAPITTSDTYWTGDKWDWVYWMHCSLLKDKWEFTEKQVRVYWMHCSLLKDKWEFTENKWEFTECTVVYWKTSESLLKKVRVYWMHCSLLKDKWEFTEKQVRVYWMHCSLRKTSESLLNALQFTERQDTAWPNCIPDETKSTWRNVHCSVHFRNNLWDFSVKVHLHSQELMRSKNSEDS